MYEEINEKTELENGDHVTFSIKGWKHFCGMHFVVPNELADTAITDAFQIVHTGHYFLSASYTPEDDYMIVRIRGRVFVGWAKRWWFAAKVGSANNAIPKG